MSHPVARTQGVADGAKAAEISNVALATAMGVQRGATVGIELGFYRGVAAAWVAKGNMCVRLCRFHKHSTPVAYAYPRLISANCDDQRGAKLVSITCWMQSHLPHVPQTPDPSVLPHPPNDGVGLGA